MFRVFFAIVNFGFLAWLVGGVSSASDDCSGYADQLSQDACAAGTGIGAVFIIFLWVAVDLILYVLHRVLSRKPREV